jgi:VanZ family protein
MLYGVSDEFHQYFVPGRSVEALDVLADALGGLLGAWMMYQLCRMTCNRSTQ